ncbi:hypothetical protein [Gimesia sp.]|uniref:hypothetical protein n=1 Tax=Gimesia sp. TaxID=2024833 RepID=UPI003A8F69E6
MAQSEEILWDILTIMEGNNSIIESKSGDIEAENEVKNAYGVHNLKAVLLLKYLPADIEDTIYFMKHRDYLNLEKHGYGQIALLEMFTLTEKALSVYEDQLLPKEEEKAFKESLWKIEPEYYGIGPNLKAWKRAWKKFFNRRK